MKDAQGPIPIDFFCRICGSPGPHKRFLVPEMMFGTGEVFTYVQCPACECLQIQDIPADLSRHYPPNYYSLAERKDIGAKILSLALDKRDAFAYRGHGWLGRLFYAFSPNPALRHIRTLHISHDARVLDVGSGGGRHLRILFKYGFKRLTGIDPHLAVDADLGSGIKIIKRSLEDFQGEFDFMMLHHSLEHMSDQNRAFAAIERMLAPGGFALIRVPYISSFAWERYGVCWAGLDAPRHLYLHSISSLRTMAARAGLRIRQVIWDSTAFQLWASDQYEHGITLYSRSSLLTSPARMALSYRKLRRMEKIAERLNREERGDQIAFVLEKG